MHRKRKLIISLISIITGMFLVICCLFINEYKTSSEYAKEKNSNAVSLISSLSASFDSLSSLLEKGITVNDFSNFNKDIYTYCLIAKNTLSLSTDNTENCSFWLSDLAEYAKTSMNDSEKNNNFFITSEKASIHLAELCISNKEKNLKQLDTILKEVITKQKYEDIYNTQTKNYAMLDNYMNYTLKEVSEYAKTLLKTKLTPQKTNNAFSHPLSASYHSKNAYADILYLGKILKTMAYEDTSEITDHTPKDPIKSAEKYVRQHAPYIENIKLLYTQKTKNITYCVFYPVKIINNTNEIIFLNEKIVVAVNNSHNDMKAFDVSEYLKNHASNNDYLSNVELFYERNSNESKNKSFFYLNGDVFLYKKVIGDHHSYYLLEDLNGNVRITDEKTIILN